MKKLLLILAMIHAIIYAQEKGKKTYILHHTKLNQRFELLTCIEKKEILKVAQLLYEGANPNRPVPNHGPPLIAAINTHEFYMVKLLLDYHADPNKRDWHTHEVPLICAVEQFQDEIALQLVSGKANLDLTNKSGNTALTIACKRFRYSDSPKKIIETFLKEGALTNIPNKRGKTPLHYMCTKDLQLTELLIQKGAHVNHADVDKYTPLHKAVIAYAQSINKEKQEQQDKQDQIKLAAIIHVLLAAGACPDLKNKYDITAREYADSNTRKISFFVQKELQHEKHCIYC
jgi:ankyrin repeat protein